MEVYLEDNIRKWLIMATTIKYLRPLTIKKNYTESRRRRTSKGEDESLTSNEVINHFCIQKYLLF